MDTQALVLQLRFSAWASERVLQSAAAVPQEELGRNLGNSFGGVRGTLVRIYPAGSIWCDRLMGDATPYDRTGVAANLDRYEAPTEFSDFSRKWLGLLDGFIAWGEKLQPADWDRVVSYHNMKGEALKT